jgi:hypothetical protein
MLRPYGENGVLLAMMEALVRDGDWAPVREAFESTQGDFTAKFVAAVEARFAQMVRPEVFIDVPERPEELGKADLDGNPIPKTEEPSGGRRPERPLRITALRELGEVTVLLPDEGWERPELTMMPGGIGEWEAALHAVLGVAHERGPATTVRLDAHSNQALVPEDARWWPMESAPPLWAAADPGVASELLATSPSLGGLPILDDEDECHEAVVTALGSVADWRYSPRWSLEMRGPGDGVPTLATARAAIAGWAEHGRSGLIVYVYGGALHAVEGLVGVPSPLHSHLLCVTRSADGTDTVDTVHRVHLSCPGEYWCHRGGCPDAGFMDAAPLLEPVIAAGDTAAVADASEGWAGEAFQRLYGTGEPDEYTENVLDQVAVMLSSAGWVELNRSTWEGGVEDLLLRRDEHCLLVSYDPVTCQIRLGDGKHELDVMLQSLVDEGVLTGDEGQEVIETSETAQEQWGMDLLMAAEDFLRGRIEVLGQLATPVQGALLGLHPHADGSVRGPEAMSLVESQLTALLGTADLLRGGD